jgi:hypothetical protein
LAPPTKTPKPTLRPRTATPRPTETPRPQQIIFQDDFSHGIDIEISPNAWEYYNNQGAAIEIIDDPTNSTDSSGNPRGKVLKCSVSGDSKLEPSGTWVRRGYLTWANTGSFHNSETVQAPAAIQTDVYVPRDTLRDPNPAVTILGFHSNRKGRTAPEDPSFSAGVTADRSGYLRMGSQGRWELLTGVRFPFDTWFTVRLEVGSDGIIRPYINGKLAYPSGMEPYRIPDNIELGFGDGHAGWYSSPGSNPTPDFPQGAWLLNDNFEVIQYLESSQ